MYDESCGVLTILGDEVRVLGPLPVAATDIVHHEQQDDVTALLLGLKGIRIAKLGWKPRVEAE